MRNRRCTTEVMNDDGWFYNENNVMDGKTGISLSLHGKYHLMDLTISDE